MIIFPVAEVDGRFIAFDDTWGAARPGGRSHQGTDIAVFDGPIVVGKHWVAGSPVVAAFDGKLESAGANNPLGGPYALSLSDGTGQRAYYGHLMDDVGDTPRDVTAGEVIGHVGKEGVPLGVDPHLHFQYTPSGDWVDPYPYLLKATRVSVDPASNRKMIAITAGLALAVVGLFWAGLRAFPTPKRILANPIQRRRFFEIVDSDGATVGYRYSLAAAKKEAKIQAARYGRNTSIFNPDGDYECSVTPSGRFF